MSDTINPIVDKQAEKGTPLNLLENGMSSSIKLGKRPDIQDELSRKDKNGSAVERICRLLQGRKLNSSNDEILENNEQIKISTQLLIDTYFLIKDLEEELENSDSKLVLAKRVFDRAISDLALSQRNHKLERMHHEKEVSILNEKVANLYRIIAQQDIRLNDFFGENNFAHNSESPL